MQFIDGAERKVNVVNVLYVYANGVNEKCPLFSESFNAPPQQPPFRYGAQESCFIRIIRKGGSKESKPPLGRG